MIEDQWSRTRAKLLSRALVRRFRSAVEGLEQIDDLNEFPLEDEVREFQFPTSDGEQGDELVVASPMNDPGCIAS